MSLQQFWQAVAYSQAERNAWRFGQSLFNICAQMKPHLAEIVRGTQDDPFYATEVNDPRVRRFLEYITNNWEVALGTGPEEASNYEWDVLGW